MAKIVYSKEYKGEFDVLLPGVTTVLANLGWNKAILMAWAAKMARQEKDYKEESKAAAEIGTLAHKIAEDYLRGEETTNAVLEAYSEKQIEKARNAVRALREWQKGSKLEVKYNEAALISNEYGYGGTADIIFANPDGELELADIKTGNGTYADYILQLAAYAMAAEETYKRTVKRVHILRFGKNKSATFHHSSWGLEDIDKAFTVFKYLLAIHKLRPEIEELL
jgi:hypothetical protein